MGFIFGFPPWDSGTGERAETLSEQMSQALKSQRFQGLFPFPVNNNRTKTVESTEGKAMIVVMKPHATKEMVDAMAKRVEEMGLKAHVIVGTERTVIAAIGEKRNGEQAKLESCEEVEKVVPILAPYKVASVETRPEPTVVTARDLKIGGGHVGVIAGPCSVEDEEQILQVAAQVKEAGATGLRGGAFKPRTSPYSFQGLKEDGLKLLAAARDMTGLAVVTEVMTPEHVELLVRYADVLQIGARNMQNYHLLQAVGDTDLPVLLKRGPSATIDEFLLAAEYVLDRGNKQVALCERGVRTFESHTRFTLPLATVPYLHERTHLPVVIDPSHGTGHASLVPSMCAASVAVGCDGLIIEVHPDPPRALSDGAQSITTGSFRGDDGPMPKSGWRAGAGDGLTSQPARCPCRCRPPYFNGQLVPVAGWAAIIRLKKRAKTFDRTNLFQPGRPPARCHFPASASRIRCWSTC